jgi:tRNA 2-thiocytidine biosynthesis protein TtcA
MIKQMLQTWERQNPGRIDNIFNAIKNVSPSQLADTNLFEFVDLQLDRADQDVVETSFIDQIRSVNL